MGQARINPRPTGLDRYGSDRDQAGRVATCPARFGGTIIDAARYPYSMRCSEFRDLHCSFVDDTLAGVELVRMQAVVVAQKELFGEIALQRHTGFDTVFASDQPISAIEKDYV